MNFSKHLPDNNDWIEDYAAKLGWPALINYYERVHLMMSNMMPGQSFSIKDNVSADNVDLFIKCAAANMSDLAEIYHGRKGYYLDNQSTVILCR